MMYKAIVLFNDSQDKGYRYKPGDVFPREGLKVSDGRMASLASSNNLRGKPVIKEVPEKAAVPVVDSPEPPVEEIVKPVEKKRGRKRAD